MARARQSQRDGEIESDNEIVTGRCCDSCHLAGGVCRLRPMARRKLAFGGQMQRCESNNNSIIQKTMIHVIDDLMHVMERSESGAFSVSSL